MAARAPLCLGPYEVLKHLASGGMADVLLARTQKDGVEQHVVVKRIRAEQASDENYVAMFLDEARLASSLHHENVVQVHETGAANGAYFFTMEYVHGEDARRLLTALSKRDEMVPLEHVIAIVRGVAAGLHHAHEARGRDRKPLGIVHRDVSPANILIGYDGSVKVADFGIAKATQRNHQTQSGTLKGKVAYMSPEQCVGDAMDRTSDVFSLGIVLYELLTVRRLFKGDNDFLTMTSIVLGHIPPPSKYRPDIPEALEDIIVKALENKPADRYQTAEQLLVALEQFAEAHHITPSASGLADFMKRIFGTRPMPWEDDEPEVELSVDFDGSASGLVAPVVDAMLKGNLAVGAPMRRAQTETEVLASAALTPMISGPVLVEAPRVVVEEPRVVVEEALPPPPSLAQSVIMLSPFIKAKQRSRIAWIAGGAAAVLVALIALVAVASRTSEPPAARPIAKPVRPMVKAPPVEPIVPLNLAATPAPAVAVSTEPVAIPAAAPTPAPKRPRLGPGPAKKKIPPRGPVKRPTKARWTPDQLFPK